MWYTLIGFCLTIIPAVLLSLYFPETREIDDKLFSPIISRLLKAKKSDSSVGFHEGFKLNHSSSKRSILNERKVDTGQPCSNVRDVEGEETERGEILSDDLSRANKESV